MISRWSESTEVDVTSERESSKIRTGINKWVQQHLLTLIPGYSTEFGAAAYGRPRPRTKTRGTKSLAVEDGN
ncbi:uncharacterized protein Dyak_GE28451, isoform B [Drosophila yakuba]|uniref:Uncharacterized protein, isoform B n=1 Tax=Drosophila yakuba TaxID=7245 RepID=A0A0R1E8Z5_DROYA|nr:uncharacterized protein Dyak_GE28451, isoform B [Drosophila yakuba]